MFCYIKTDLETEVEIVDETLQQECSACPETDGIIYILEWRYTKTRPDHHIPSHSFLLPIDRVSESDHKYKVRRIIDFRERNSTLNISLYLPSFNYKQIKQPYEAEHILIKILVKH